MKAGDFVEVEYIAKIKETGKVFDVTSEEVAKKEEIYNPSMKYGPVVLILGADFIIKGLDEALREMKIGEKKVIDIPAEKAFGPRNDDMVKLIPASRFKEQNLDPVPGAQLNIGMMKGTIVSVSGGRVKVDFNHPLAGKTLEYDIEVKSQITDEEEKVKAVVKYFTNIDEVEVKIDGKTANVKIKKDVDVAKPVKGLVADAALKWCDIERLKFIEVYEKDDSSEK